MNKNIFNNKKSKQRYLDYAYKIGLKKFILSLDESNKIPLEDIHEIQIYMDEHTTATDGKYELREGILQELKEGTFNSNYKIFYKPICCNLKSVILNHYHSHEKSLIRVADIYANYAFWTFNNNMNLLYEIFVCDLP
ncbi:MAG: hypothetical protein K2L64_01575 [Ureaplasma sp.]|nr:hypothetical protein [Ureaplasma sp.]